LFGVKCFTFIDMLAIPIDIDDALIAYFPFFIFAIPKDCHRFF
jgi:hypothetical protein